jgi:hypothetical protein
MLKHITFQKGEPSRCHNSRTPKTGSEFTQHLRRLWCDALAQRGHRIKFAEDNARFLSLIRDQISKTPSNFEIFSFAVLKVHLEKFACRIYRDTRTAAHDSGVDLSTNFGVVYQIKKIRVQTEAEAAKLFSEIRANFDTQRIHDGNVIVVIDDISKEVKQYLVNMRIQSLSKQDVLALASHFNDAEDRQKVLRVVFDEFRREYSSTFDYHEHKTLITKQQT